MNENETKFITITREEYNRLIKQSVELNILKSLISNHTVITGEELHKAIDNKPDKE